MCVESCGQNVLQLVRVHVELWGYILYENIVTGMQACLLEQGFNLCSQNMC